MAVLARNWRCADGDLRGELDLVLRDGGTLVFCEVKARRGRGAGDPVEAVTPAKLRQLRRLAGAFVRESGLRPQAMRIDVVGVCWPRGGGDPDVTHLVAVG